MTSRPIKTLRKSPMRNNPTELMLTHRNIQLQGPQWPPRRAHKATGAAAGKVAGNPETEGRILLRQERLPCL